MGARRAAVLIGVNLLIAGHVAWWLLSGRQPTLSPVEPSESMYTLETGAVNAGFIFFLLAILSTVVFGRFFCGWGCHVVALQDLCGWVMKKAGIHPKPFRSRLLLWAPLILALYMFVWPTFKREVIKPLAGQNWASLAPYIGEAGVRPELRAAFIKKDFWETFAPWYVAIPFLGVCGFACVYFLGAKGFCSYGCPYGGFFVPADRVAAGRILVTDACEHCGHCTAVCSSNVRVHEEVRDYGMVVDPGCMKCMDCVSVCPNDALYFGFGKPAVAARPAPKADAQRHVRYDLTWPEELAAAAMFIVMVAAFRNLLGMVPLLMAMGMAGVGTFLVWKVWRMVRDPSVRLQNLQLKLKGAIKPAGWAFGILTLATLGTVVWSGAVKYNLSRGVSLDDRVEAHFEAALSPGFTPNEADKALAERAIVHLTRAGPPSLGGFGWRHPDDVAVRLARLEAITGRLDEAENHIRRGIADRIAHGSPPDVNLIGGLVRLEQRRNQSPEELAASYRRLIAEFPGVPDFHLVLAQVEMQMGRTPQAVEEAERAATLTTPGRPERDFVLLASCEILIQAEQLDTAIRVLRRAVESSPEVASIRSGLAMALAMGGQSEEALRQLQEASRLEPANPVPLRMAAELLRSIGRESEASAYDERANRLGR